MPPRPEAFFLPAGAGGSGQRFCLYHPSRTGQPRGALLHVHAFAEEMNKSRRIVALQARALADAGYAVLQLDLFGCGDSSGEIGEASWQAWIDDVLVGADWLQRHTGAELWLWGLRAGCLLAADAARQRNVACHFLFWQPAPMGKLLLQQFLRLAMAGEMLKAAGAAGVVEGLRRQLADGVAIEVAGYTLSPALAMGLEQATLLPPAPSGRLEWIETSNRPEATLLPASVNPLQTWRGAGHEVRSRVVPGPAFWQTTEIEEAPALLDATLAALRETATA